MQAERSVKTGPTGGTKLLVALLYVLGVGLFGGGIWYNMEASESDEAKTDKSSKADDNVVAVFRSAVVYITSSSGSGSGFIVTSDGYIFTNAHVTGNEIQVNVRLYSGMEYAADVVAIDPATDLAILKIPATDLTTAYLANSDSVQQGASVIVIGFPLGANLGDEPYVSEGIISSIRLADNRFDTDAAINPGNSGGPMISKSAKGVIGIVFRKVVGTGVEGIGSAIPINVAKRFFKDTAGLDL